MKDITQRALIDARIAALFDRLPALAVAELAELGRIFTMAAGDLLCAPSFSPCGLSILLDGRAQLSLALQPVMEIGVGGCFGEEAVINVTPPTVTIHAIEAGHFWQIPREALQDYLATHLDVANRIFLNLLHETANRLAHSNALYADAKTQAGEFQRMLVMLSQETTAQQTSEPPTQYLADHDTLTGLLNRLALYDKIDRIIAQASVKPGGLAVFVLDLDGFKVVNDLYGHVAGDQVLIEVAARLTIVAEQSEIVARIGGDEFVVLQLLPRLRGEPFPYASVGRMADALMAAVSKPFRIRGIENNLSVSLGVALFPFDGKRAEELLRHAELAMSSAKSEGGDHFLPFTSHLGRKAMRSNQLKADLRRAVDRGELDLYFQPQFGLAEGRIVGVEALVRWQHPVFGVVSPTEFVPLAEQNGLISPVGEWVMQRVGEVALAANASAPRPVRFAVNVSPIQFRHRNIEDVILRHYQKQSVPPEWLTIEITEGALLYDAESTASALDRLRAAGFGVSVDDFGTGYASLSYLAQLSASEVKIDQSFIQRLGGAGMSVRDKDMVLIKAIISMTHSLGLSVIAEGVENLEQLTQLRALGCDGIQGYIFCKPLKEQALLNFLRQPVCIPDKRRPR